MFDIDFYPSISPENIKNALKFARKFVDIPAKHEDVILHACETLLVHQDEPWMKRNSGNLFDVPMGSFHGAELCELIGLFILNGISRIITPGRYGLYRDDGLAVIRAQRPCNLIKIENSIKSSIKSMGFEITIESGLVSTDFLDVTLDLRRDAYHPFTKPNSKTKYVNRLSNHPPHITKAIPNMVHQRLCRISKNEDEFNNNTSHCLDELKLSGYDTDELTYRKPAKKKRSRKRKVIYYHPPFSKSVQTNIGRVFRNLVRKHFTPDHYLYKVLNKNTLKISYSCLPNMKSILSAHNKNILKGPASNAARTESCNCKKKTTCPLDGSCQTSSVIYKAEVTTATAKDFYIGSTSRAFKERYYEHMEAIRNKDSTRHTALSRHIWKLKSKGEAYAIKWSIVTICKRFSMNLKFCTLCNLERLEIAHAEEKTLLNKRNELVTMCRHNPKLFF